GCGYEWFVFVLCGQPVPIFPQGSIVHRLALDTFHDGLAAQLGHHRTLEHSSFLKLGYERQDSFPIQRHLLRAQLQAQRRRMLLGKFLEYIERVVVASLVEQHFGLRHEFHRVFFRICARRSREIFVARGECTHAVRRACREDRRKGRRLAGLERRCGSLFGTAEASLEKVDQRLIEGGSGAGLGTPLLEDVHSRRHGRRNDDRANHGVEGNEQAERQYHREVERNLRTPWRQDHQHIAIVVARDNDQPDRERKQSQYPQDGTHQAALALT